MAAILVVEPHEQVSELIRRFLEPAGHSVVCVRDPTEGDRLYQKGHFDLVMGDGQNTVKWLEQLHSGAQPVLVVTGTVTSGLPTVTKPFVSDDLLRRVTELLQSAKD